MQVDVVIVGAGLIGSSVAMHLSQLSSYKIIVVDLDLEGGFSSSELNAGGVRTIWNHPANSELSKVSIEYYSNVSDEIGFRQKGYLWMQPQGQFHVMKEKLKKNSVLKELEYLEPHEVSKRYSFVDKTTDIGGAFFSPKDGLLNSNLLKLHYRRIAKQKGVQFIDRLWITKLDCSKTPYRIYGNAFPQQLDSDFIKEILMGTPYGDKPLLQDTQTLEISAPIIVCCTGAWARPFAEILNLKIHSFPVRRQVCLFECKGLDLSPYGMFVDPSGVYFHSEANNILSGYANADEPSGYCFDYDGEAFFEKHIWPSLYERSTYFENLKHVTGWAGLYEVSADKSAIIGKVSGFSNIFEAHSFSGHGAMQSYGAGLGLAELIVKGKYQSIDLSLFDGQRFQKNQPINDGLLI